MEWTDAWRELVEGSDPRAARRVHQGRAYHRAGRVSNLRVFPGGAGVRVQGDRATPYSVTVTMPVLGDEAWSQIVETLARQVRHTARLLAGHAPDSLDAELSADVRVFPRLGELEVACDCDDETWPCSHAAGLWEAVAERLEEDPFALLQMRGRGRERLLSELSAARRRRTQGDVAPGLGLQDLGAQGWTAPRGSIDDIFVPPTAPPRTPAGTLRLLGDPPGWAGGVDAWSLLYPLIEDAAEWVRSVDET